LTKEVRFRQNAKRRTASRVHAYSAGRPGWLPKT